MKINRFILWAAVLVAALQACNNPSNSTDQHTALSEVSQWITSPDKSRLLARQDVALNFIPSTPEGENIIEIDDNQKYQVIDGFGFTLTGGSAELINAIPSPQREQLIREIFSSKGKGIGSNYLRISIGASDLSSSLFTYNEVPGGGTDLPLDNFSLEPDRKDLIPVLKMIRAVNPEIKIMASPWTAPTWMKDNRSFIGGRLKPEFYEAYANYLVRYIQSMRSEGIPIDAITPQNEPLHDGNNPSMYMSAQEQANFIKEALGPKFREANINTRIVIYDHNADRPDYPISILNDPEAKKYIDGTAFHLYAGKIEALSEVREAHPDRNIYFTEQWVGGPQNFAEDLTWHVENLIIGATRNWSRTVLEWNLASDPDYGPHTDQGGCDRCLGALTINGSEVTRNVAYYVIGHAAKFVPSGSRRIASTMPAGLPNVGFLTPTGEKVLIVLNKSGSAQDFTISHAGKTVQTSLAAGDISTFVW